MFGAPLFNVTEVENHQLCVDSSSVDADTLISKYLHKFRLVLCIFHTIIHLLLLLQTYNYLIYSNLEGRRIVDISHLFNQIKNTIHDSAHLAVLLLIWNINVGM